jgi:hypothetical protein
MRRELSIAFSGSPSTIPHRNDSAIPTTHVPKSTFFSDASHSIDTFSRLGVPLGLLSSLAKSLSRELILCGNRHVSGLVIKVTPLRPVRPSILTSYGRY